MRIRSEVPISNIIMDRWPMNLRTLRLIDHLRSGGSVPPIKVQPNGRGQLRILDGRHRVLAFKMIGRTTIHAKYSTKLDRKVN